MSMDKRIFLVVILIALITFGGWFFYDNETKTYIPDNEPEEVTGSLTIDSSNSEGEWYVILNSEEESKDIKKLTQKEEEANCLGGPDVCSSFFQKDDDLIGSEIRILGFLEDEHLKVKRVEFLESEFCSFDFDHFKVKTEDFNNYQVDFSTNPDAQEFETRITEAVESGPNFAGRYTYAEWGCGTNCGAGAIINPETGKIIEYGILNSHGVEFERDSRLLIVNPSESLEYLEDSDLLQEETTKYFLMTDEELLLLCKK